MLRSSIADEKEVKVIFIDTFREGGRGHHDNGGEKAR
jgi:hypothetical protein